MSEDAGKLRPSGQGVVTPTQLSPKAIEGFSRRYQRELIKSKRRRINRRIERLSPTFKFALERLYSDDGLELMAIRWGFGRKHDPLALKRITVRTARAMRRVGLVAFVVIPHGGTFLWLTVRGRERADVIEKMGTGT